MRDFPDSVQIPVGPQHPALKEPTSFTLPLQGEMILQAGVRLGYNHRGIEQLAEAKSYDQILFLVERICGICSTSHPFASVNAISWTAVEPASRMW